LWFFWSEDMKQAHEAQSLLWVPGLMCDQAVWAPLQGVALLCERVTLAIIEDAPAPNPAA
jgi:hypothetical protein